MSFEEDARISTTRESIRRDSRSLRNRLLSIHRDARFVASVADILAGLPILPNERCGSWYLDPRLPSANAGSVYFKSTDGHFGKWDFNLRRMNRHLVDVIERGRGCIIVDSTRHGKRIPDSLAKTIPIWCCTINNIVARTLRGADTVQADRWDTELHTLPFSVSRSEHDQIANLIPSFVEKTLNAASISIPHLSKPLRPLWVHPDAPTRPPRAWADPEADLPFHPVVLVSASIAVPDGFERRDGWCYVQGSADDHESWAMGLTAEMFWEHVGELVATTTTTECEDLVRNLVSTRGTTTNPARFNSCAETFSWIGGTGIAIGDGRSGDHTTCWIHFGAVLNCGGAVYPEHADSGGKYLSLSIPEGKKGQHALFESLGKAIEFIVRHRRMGRKVLVHCMQGKDVSVAIVVAFLVAHMRDVEDIVLDKCIDKALVTKRMISDRLFFIQQFRSNVRH